MIQMSTNYEKIIHKFAIARPETYTSLLVVREITFVKKVYKCVILESNGEQGLNILVSVSLTFHCG